MSHEKIWLAGPPETQVEGLIGAERHVRGVDSLDLLLAQVGAYLVEAVPAIARFRVLPRWSRWVQEGLRGAVSGARRRVSVTV